jgi:Spy/CpxP family protein refolding chaperone
MLSGLICAVTALAWAEPSAPPTSAPAVSDQPAAGLEYLARRNHELHYLTNLRRAMTEELRLTDDQHRAIRELFADHTRFVEEYTPDRATQKDSTDIKERRRALVRALRQARRDGDRSRVEALLAELRSLRPADPLRDATSAFHAAVAEVLDPMQREEFHHLVRQYYRVERPMRERAQGLRQIRQALDRVSLRDEQQAAIHRYFREAMEVFGAEGWKSERAEAATETLRRNVLAVLDEDQQTVFNAALEALDTGSEPMAPPRGAGHPTRLDQRPPPPLAGEPADAASR